MFGVEQILAGAKAPGKMWQHHFATLAGGVQSVKGAGGGYLFAPFCHEACGSPFWSEE